ncbi:DIRAS family, GTP-binding Ras-like 1 [Sarotherodon galilaeus]
MFNSRLSPKQGNYPAVLSNPENLMCDTTMSTRSENENSVVVTADQIRPPIKRCFERLSGVQWSMIERGAGDSGARALLADMICEIIQIASSRILKNALPVIQDRMTKEEPLDAGKINSSLGDSISAAIASALNVPKQRHESADELTRMVEEEISEKVSSVVKLIRESPDLPQDPAVYVSGKFSNIKKLDSMVCLAASCLKRHVACKLRCQCVSSGSDFGTESTTLKMSVQSVITEISVILSWRSSDGEMTDKDEDEEETELPDESALTEKDKIKQTAESVSIRAPTPVKVIAADIVNEILGNMDLSSEELCERCSLSKPAFNAGLIINKLRDFFSRCLPSTSHSGLKARKHGFSIFAKKQFEKMKKELRKVIKANRIFFVCLKNTCKYPKSDTVPSDEGMVFSLSGSQSTEAHRAPSRNTLLRYIRSSPVDFDAIRSDVNQLFEKLTKTEELFINHKTQENFRNSGSTRDFTLELTAKMFDLLMTDRLYQIPEPLMGRSLSDTVISQTPQPAHGSKRPFSAEVLYVLVEDTVEKFVQQLLLWVENEGQAQMIEDKVSVAVEDIQNLIRRTRTPTKETSPDSDGSGRESVPLPVTAKSGSITPEKCSLARDQKPQTEKSWSITPERSSLAADQSINPERFSLAADQTQKSGSINPEKCSASVSGVLKDSSDMSEMKILTDPAFRLMMRLIKKSKPETQHFFSWKSSTTTEPKAVFNRLRGLMHPEISSTESATGLMNDNKKFIKEIAKCLIKEFGSADNVLKNAMANDACFDEALVKHLKICLSVIPSPPKKSKISRFFSALGKTLRKPFRWFTKARDD